ncbi:MAG: hypothetical protein HUJ27_14980 [Rhodobacteraceae bacterium]|nr:hypothetical protein [Paracoccaceae bacterium]
MPIVLIILSAIPAFLMVRGIFRLGREKAVAGWVFYWLAAVIAVVINPILTILAIAFLGMFLPLGDTELIFFVVGPIGGLGAVGGVIGATAAIMLALKAE